MDTKKKVLVVSLSEYYEAHMKNLNNMYNHHQILILSNIPLYA